MGRFYSAEEIDVYYSHADTRYEKQLRDREREKIDRMNAYRRLDEDKARAKSERRTARARAWSTAKTAGHVVGSAAWGGILGLVIWLLLAQTVFIVFEKPTPAMWYLEDPDSYEKFMVMNAGSSYFVPVGYYDYEGKFVGTSLAEFYAPRYIGVGGYLDELQALTVNEDGTAKSPLWIAFDWLSSIMTEVWNKTIGSVSTFSLRDAAQDPTQGEPPGIDWILPEEEAAPPPSSFDWEAWIGGAA